MIERFRSAGAAISDRSRYQDAFMAVVLGTLIVLGMTVPMYAIGRVVTPFWADIAIVVAMIELVPAWILVYRGIRRRRT